ncbi:MAG: LON peptidase substrate-binding domain-containing protein [Anaeromyxobacter sp.]
MITLIQRSDIPAVVPLLPLVGTVLFPAGQLPVSLATPKTMAAAEAALACDGPLVVVARSAPPDHLDAELLTVGTLARIVRTRREQRRLSCTIQGLARVHVTSFVQRSPYLSVNIAALDDEPTATVADLAEFRARTLELLLQDAESAPFSWVVTCARIADPGHLIDMAVANARTSPALKQRVLEATSLQERLAAANEILCSLSSKANARPTLLRRGTIALRSVRWQIAAWRGHLPVPLDPP